MARHDSPPRMTEPVVVPCHFLTGLDAQVIEGDLIRVTGWVDLPIVGYDGPERRIVARVVMPNDVARGLLRDLRKKLVQVSH